MNGVKDEYAAEARFGLEIALRNSAFPPSAGADVVAESTWQLNSPAGYRTEVSRADRAVCALLSGDELAAAREIETAGPVGTVLMCLRCTVHAQRSHLDGVSADQGETGLLRGVSAAEYVTMLTQSVAVPVPDRPVWTTAAESAQVLADQFVFTPLPAARERGPLSALAEAVVARSLLARRAFAAVFVAHFASLLRTSGEERGLTAMDCAREYAALTIAYLEGRNVTIDAAGKLQLLLRSVDDGRDI